MTLTPEQTATAFSQHDFAAAYPALAPDVVWEAVGAGEPTVGRDAVVAVCEASAAYLATVTTTVHRFRVVVGAGTVVVDSVTTYREATGDASHVASCDLYDFRGETLTRITSYTVELPAAPDANSPDH